MDGGATMFFVTEKSEKTALTFLTKHSKYYIYFYLNKLAYIKIENKINLLNNSLSNLNNQPSNFIAKYGILYIFNQLNIKVKMLLSL